MEDIQVKTNSFDTILLLENDFGPLGTSTKAQKLLKKFYAFTSPEACILAESTNPYKTREAVHVRYRAHNKRTHKMPGSLRIRYRFREYISDWVTWLNVSKKEMKNIVKGTGWKIVRYIDSKKRPWYIAVLKKEKA